MFADLKLIAAIVAFFRAIAAALKGTPKTTSYPAEHLPDGHPDAAPPHPKRTPKYKGIPGFDSDTGTPKANEK